jgi:hypothetical protein
MSGDRQILTVEVWSIGSYDMPMEEFVCDLNKAWDTVPVEFRSKAQFVTERDYDGGYFYRCEYTRPETDAEMAARKMREKAWEAEREARDRAEYTRLAQKYQR